MFREGVKSKHSTLLNEVLSWNAQESELERKSQLTSFLLNEVLSLNAQESDFAIGAGRNTILNEVLSLNAQECHDPDAENRKPLHVLNEVLSLNAQE